MENIYFILDVVLYLVVISDIVQTTVSMQGGGWVTSRLSHIIWLIFLNFDLALLQVAYDNYFEVITSVFGMDLVKEEPPAIALNKLQKEDLIKGDKNKLWPAKKTQYHRKIFKTLLEYAGWRWEDVYGSPV